MVLPVEHFNVSLSKECFMYSGDRRVSKRIWGENTWHKGSGIQDTLDLENPTAEGEGIEEEHDDEDGSDLPDI